jgi:hypothetical protein
VNRFVGALAAHRAAWRAGAVAAVAATVAAGWMAQVSPQRAAPDDIRPVPPGTAPAGQTPGVGGPTPGAGRPSGAAPRSPTGTTGPDQTGTGGAGPVAGGPAAPPRATPTPTTGAADLRPGDLLDQSDPRPDGVAAQLRIFLGGVSDGDCGVDDGSGPPRIVVSPDGEIPSPLFACVFGFDPTEPLLVTLTRADGAAEATTVPGPGAGTAFVVNLMLRPGWPTGTYGLAVRQGRRAVNAVVAVRRVALPTIWFATPDVVAGGDNALYLGGYPPGRSVTLYLYGSAHRVDMQPYRTSVTTPIDERGEGQLLIHTRPRHAGCYGVTSVPVIDPERLNPTAEFCVTGSRSAPERPDWRLPDRT